MKQRTDEWLEYRRSRIGSSDAPIIMGVSPWRTPHQLWLDKLMGKELEITPAMQRGIDLEDDARKLFELMTGLIVAPTVIECEERPWQIASLDGMTFEKDAIVEIKCTGKNNHVIAQNGKVPEHYYPQLQHQLAVTGLQMVYYFSFDGENGVIVKVERNEEYIANLIVKELEFYLLLVDSEPPPIGPKDMQEIDDPKWKIVVEEYIELTQQLKTCEKREEELKDQLIHLSKGNSVIGSGLRLAKFIQKGKVDYEKIPQLQDIDLNQYRKPSYEVWRITLA